MTIETVVLGGLACSFGLFVAGVAVWWLEGPTSRRERRVRWLLHQIEEFTSELDRGDLPPDHVEELRRSVTRLQGDLVRLGQRRTPGGGVHHPPPAPS
jgi:hypothetical protein